MALLIIAFFTGCALAQSDMPELSEDNWFKLYATPDGRVEANLKGGGYYGETDPYTQVFRNFIEIDQNTGNLLVVYGIAEQNLRITANLVGVTIYSGQTITSPPRTASAKQDGWFQDNMILWWDVELEGMVMIYQEGCMSCWKDFEDDWLTDTDLDAMNQTIWKSITFDGGETWTPRVQLLPQVYEPHVHYQIMPGLEKDENGYTKELMIPVHHLDENVTDYNYQMVWRCNRRIDPDDGSWSVVNMTNNSSTDVFGGFIQASIVRPDDDAHLVAFLRDRNGQWMRRTESFDDGYTWANPEVMPIPNADLMAQAIMLHSGRVLLIYNPQQSFPTGSDTGDRLDNTHHLVASLSNDAGLTWQFARPLEYHYDCLHAYPVATQDPGCENVYITYSMGVHQEIFSLEEDYTPAHLQLSLGCEAWNGVNDTMYDECVERTTPHNYIKFQILNEGWIMREDNFTLNKQGCFFTIPETVMNDIEYMQGTTDGTIDLSSASSDEVDDHLDWIAVILGAVLVLILLLDLCYFCRRKRNGKKEPSRPTGGLQGTVQLRDADVSLPRWRQSNGSQQD